MNILNEEVRAIKTQLAVLKKEFKENPHDLLLEDTIIRLEKELADRLEKLQRMNQQ